MNLTKGRAPLFLLTTWVALASLDVFAQGTVHFGGNTSTRIRNGWTGLPARAADGIKAALYWAPIGSTNFVQLGTAVDAGIPLPGLFIGGTRTTGLETAGGTSAQFQVRAWEAAYGQTYEEARSAPLQAGRGALLGRSVVLAIRTGNATPPTPPALLTANGLAGFEVNPSLVAPSIQCPADFSTMEKVAAFPLPPANGIPVPLVFCAPPSGSTLHLGTNFITCIATNTAGVDECSFTISLLGPPNDNFGHRALLVGTNATANVDNTRATKEAGEPDILGNPGGNSVWWTWTAPKNGTVTIKTEGSGFDTLLAVYTGDSLTNLMEVAAGDDTLGADPLSSLVTFHAAGGATYQIAVDGYQGFDHQVASGNILLSLDFVFDRYTIGGSVNDTNRGIFSISPPPDADGRYLVGTQVTITASPAPGWLFGSWNGDLVGTNSHVTLTLTNNLSFTANFITVLVKTVGRSPSGFEIYGLANRSFDVWSPEPGALNYRIDSDVPWMFVDPHEGVSRGQTNTHHIIFNGLGPGNYLGTLLITPLVEGGLPQSVVVSLRVDAASLSVRWHTNFEASGEVRAVLQTPEGGFILGGSAPNSPPFGLGIGDYDFVVARLNADGQVLWTKRFGGEGSDTLRSLQLTADGGFVLAGESSSGTNGNKTSPGFGNSDLWVVRLDSEGNKLWDRSFGGSNIESVGLVKQTGDGGFVLAGSSESGASGNKASPNFGGPDFWVVRLDPNGKRLWDKSFGGTAEENLDFLDTTADGQIFLGGASHSNPSGNKTNQTQGYWLIRLDASGNKLAELGLGSYIVKVGLADDGGFVALNEQGANPGRTLYRFDSVGNPSWSYYLQPLSGRTCALFKLENLSDNRVQVFGSLQWCCSGSLQEIVTLDASGQIVRDQVLLQNPSFVATAAARTSDGGWILCNDRFEIYVLNPAPDARSTKQPVYSTLGYRFMCNVETNGPYLTQFSTNLIDWLPLQRSQCFGTELEVFDKAATNSPMRFYRTIPGGQ